MSGIRITMGRRFSSRIGFTPQSNTLIGGARLTLMTEGETIRRIREAVKQGRLAEPFSPHAVNHAVQIDFAGVFLPKHRVGNPGWKGKPYTELFIQISKRPALYRLK